MTDNKVIKLVANSTRTLCALQTQPSNTNTFVLYSYRPSFLQCETTPARAPARADVPTPHSEAGGGPHSGPTSEKVHLERGSSLQIGAFKRESLI